MSHSKQQNFTFQYFLDKYQKVPIEEFENQVDAQNPQIMICVCAYNHEKYIGQCLDSIVAQKTSFAYGIYVGEDESKDNTREICKEYAAKYPDKIKLILHNQKNKTKHYGRPSGKFNLMYGLLCSRAKYIAFCDGDDYWTDPLKLQKQFDFLESHNEYIGCHANVDFLFNETGEIKTAHSKPLKDLNGEQILEKNPIVTLSALVRNHPDIAQEWMIEAPLGDLSIYLSLTQHGQMAYLDENVGVYRQGVGVHSTRNRSKRIRARIDSLNQMKNALPAMRSILSRYLLKTYPKYYYQVARQMAKDIVLKVWKRA